MRLTKTLKKKCTSLKNQKNSENFWAYQSQKLTWFKQPTEILPTKSNNQKWFSGGKINLAYNCLETKIQDSELIDSPAIFYGNLTTEKSGYLTYKQLRKKVFQKVKGLKKLNISKGDKVLIYMPNIVEAVEIVLACSVIGACFEFQHYGLGVLAIKKNLIEFNPDLIVTSSCSIEADGINQNKFYIDLAKEECGRNDIKCLVLQRNEKKLFNFKDNDINFDDLLEKNNDFEYEWMDSNDSLHVFNSFCHYFVDGELKIDSAKLIRENGPFAVGLLRSMTRTLDLNKFDIMMTLSNLSSTIGLSYGIFGPLLVGGTSYLLEDIFNFPDKSNELILENKIKTIFIHNSILKDTLKNNPDFIKNSNLNSLYVNGSFPNNDYRDKIYNDCKENNIFCSRAYFHNDLGLIGACDDWKNPFIDNKEMKVFPLKNINLIEKPNTSHPEYNELLVDYSSHPGIFRNTLNSENLKKHYFDENHNLKIFTAAKINPDNSLTLETKNFEQSPYSLLSGIKILKTHITDLIKSHSKVEDVYLISNKTEENENFILFLSLTDKKILQMEKKDKDKFFDEIKEDLHDYIGDLVNVDKILIFDVLPRINTKNENDSKNQHYVLNKKKMNKLFLMGVKGNVFREEQVVYGFDELYESLVNEGSNDYVGGE